MKQLLSTSHDIILRIHEVWMILKRVQGKASQSLKKKKSCFISKKVRSLLSSPPQGGPALLLCHDVDCRPTLVVRSFGLFLSALLESPARNSWKRLFHCFLEPNLSFYLWLSVFGPHDVTPSEKEFYSAGHAPIIFIIIVFIKSIS